MTDLQIALQRRIGDYREALDRLRLVVDDNPEASACATELREAVELVRCLRRLLDGRSIAEIHSAFGAPGDFGYETAIGEALDKTYRAPR